MLNIRIDLLTKIWYYKGTRKIASNFNLVQSLGAFRLFSMFWRTFMAISSDSYAYQRSRIINKKIDALLSELPECCTQFIFTKATSGKFQPRTRLAYLEDLTTFFKYLCSAHEDFLHLEPKQITSDMLDRLTTQDIEEFLAYCEMYESDAGINVNKAPGKARKLSAIRSLFKYLVGRNQLKQNVASNVDSPRIDKSDVVYMGTEQQERLLNNLYAGKHMNTLDNAATYDPNSIILIRDIAIISLFLGTGIRISELVALDLDDLDDSDLSILVTRKGGKHQKVYFSPEVYDALLRYLDYSRRQLLKLTDEEEDDKYTKALFISQRRSRLAVRSVQAMLEKYTDYTFGKESKQKYSPHKLRSSYATNLLQESGGDLALTCEALGHANFASANRYISVLNKQNAAIGLRNGNKTQ